MIDPSLKLIDETLVLEAQMGNTEAIDLLVQRWQGRLRAYAGRLVRCDHIVCDVTQEAWISIVKGLPGLSDPGAFPAWAYRIVTNKCRDRLRKEIRHKERSEPFVDNAHDARGSCGDSMELREAFERLSGDMQAVLTLRYFEGFAVTEISEILAIAEGTVKSRLHRARTELKKILEK